LILSSKCFGGRFDGAGGGIRTHEIQEFLQGLQHRYITRFFAAFFPSFFVGEASYWPSESLAGDEIHEQEDRRKHVRVNFLPRDEVADPSSREVPPMRIQTIMERWPSRRTFWKSSTLPLQTMWTALFKVVGFSSTFFLFCPMFLKGLILVSGSTEIYSARGVG
jgi:hypothetical protein